MLGLLIAEISIKFRLATTNLERYSSMLTEDYITEVYCFIDDMMKECWKNIRKRGPGPKISVNGFVAIHTQRLSRNFHRYYFRIR